MVETVLLAVRDVLATVMVDVLVTATDAEDALEDVAVHVMDVERAALELV